MHLQNTAYGFRVPEVHPRVPCGHLCSSPTLLFTYEGRGRRSSVEHAHTLLCHLVLMGVSLAWWADEKMEGIVKTS